MNLKKEEIDAWLKRIANLRSQIESGTYEGDKDALILNMLRFTESMMREVRKTL